MNSSSVNQPSVISPTLNDPRRYLDSLKHGILDESDATAVKKPRKTLLDPCQEMLIKKLNAPKATTSSNGNKVSFLK